MPTHILSNAHVTFVLTQTGNTITARLDSRHSETTWGPSLPFVLEAYSWMLQAAEPVKNGDWSLHAAENYIEVTNSLSHPYTSVSATVRFALDDGELLVTIPPSGLHEPRPEVSLISAIHVLPDLMSVDCDPAAHLVLPQRQGVLCYPGRHPATQDQFLIYGEQRRWELLPLLPCCGAVRVSSQSALLAIAEAGDHDAQCRVALDGHGTGSTGFALCYRYTPIDPVDPIERRLRFVPLHGSDANYSGMGRRMHRFVMDRCARGTLEERIQDNEPLAYASSAFVLKILHACKEVGPLDGSGPLHVHTTCEEAKAQLSRLKAAGIDRIWVQLTGWNPEGHDGKWPTRFPIESAIGGDDKFRELIRHGQWLGFQMQVHDNYLDNYLASPDFDEAQCIGSLYGGPLKRGCWGGGLMYAGWGNAFPESRLRPPMHRLRDEYGVQGTLYVDDMGFPLEISYNLAHGEARYRRACAEGINRVLQAGREVFGACGTENGFFYCVPDADYICSTWQSGFPADPPSRLADESVPLWLMAVKGHLFSNLHDTYQAAIDFAGREEWTIARRMLMMAEYGLAPRNESVAQRNPWWCYPLDDTLHAMKLEYDLMINTIPGTIRASLDHHEVLQGTADAPNRVTRSCYSEGTEILCDYANMRLTINGQDYPLPVDYVKRQPVDMWTRPAAPAG